MRLSKNIKGKNIYVRWVGAFRAPKNESGERYSLLDSLLYEFRTPHEVACEPIGYTDGLADANIYWHKNSWDPTRQGSQVNARVGLLIDRSCIIKKFRDDCWSEYDKNGHLVKTRKGKHCSNHSEAWTNSSPIYTGLVIKTDDKGGFFNLKKTTQECIKAFLKAEPKIKVYTLKGSSLKAISRNSIL